MVATSTTAPRQCINGLLVQPIAREPRIAAANLSMNRHNESPRESLQGIVAGNRCRAIRNVAQLGEVYVKSILLVALGGAIGSVTRFKLSGWVLQLTPNWRLPLGTLAVNVIGCFVAGLLAGLAVKQDVFTPDMRVFLFTGLLGGFTTFSAFGLETLLLLKRGEANIAIAYIVVSIVAGLFVAWWGYGMTARGA
jgi:fluoride exporter